ncbi:4523_t:CDS:1, partial [Dentiscutata heterogama]
MNIYKLSIIILFITQLIFTNNVIICYADQNDEKRDTEQRYFNSDMATGVVIGLSLSLISQYLNTQKICSFIQNTSDYIREIKEKIKAR